MALLNAMQQQDPNAQTAAEGGGNPAPGDGVGQVVAGMLNKLFPDKDLAALGDLLKQHQGQAVSTVVDSIVGGIIGLLKQGQQQGKTLPVKAIMGALLPMIGKIAQSVETDEQRGAALLAELLTKIGQKLAQQGGQAGALEPAQAQELQQLVSAFVERVSPQFSAGMAPDQPSQAAQPPQAMM